MNLCLSKCFTLSEVTASFNLARLWDTLPGLPPRASLTHHLNASHSSILSLTILRGGWLMRKLLAHLCIISFIMTSNTSELYLLYASDDKLTSWILGSASFWLGEAGSTSAIRLRPHLPPRFDRGLDDLEFRPFFRISLEAGLYWRAPTRHETEVIS